MYLEWLSAEIFPERNACLQTDSNWNPQPHPLFDYRCVVVLNIPSLPQDKGTGKVGHFVLSREDTIYTWINHVATCCTEQQKEWMQLQLDHVYLVAGLLNWATVYPPKLLLKVKTTKSCQPQPCKIDTSPRSQLNGCYKSTCIQPRPCQRKYACALGYSNSDSVDSHVAVCTLFFIFCTISLKCGSSC